MEIFKKLLPGIGFVLISLFMGCAVSIYSDKDNAVNFNAYKTFAWYPKQHKNHNAKKFDNQIIESNVKNYASAELILRGYASDVNAPDVIVDYDLSIQKKKDVVSTPVYSHPYNFNPYRPNNPYGNGYYNGNYNSFPNQNTFVRGYRNRTYTYKEGTLTIYLIESKTGRLLWKGWAVGTVTDEQTYEQELRKDIHRIFKKFPVKIEKLNK